MRSKDQVFTVGKGQRMRLGKSQYPDLVRLVIPKDQAIAFAQKILSAYQTAQPGDANLCEIPLFGQLDDAEDE